MSAVDLTAHLAVLLLLIGCSAFFSSSETALFSLNPVQVQRIRTLHKRRGELVERLLRKSRRLLSAILICNTLINVAAVNVGYVIARALAPNYSEAFAIPIMTIVLLLLAEVGPKRIAFSYAERLTGFYSVVLTPLTWLLSPAHLLLDRVAALVRADLPSRPTALTDDELLTVVDVGAEQGVLDPEERSMVDGILRLADLQASDVMTPRVDLVGIDLDDPHADQIEEARGMPFRHVPAYRDTLDMIEGFIDVPRFLLDPEHNLKQAVMPAMFVPETASLDRLLTSFQLEAQRIACVLDEYGGTAGVVTRGDILEVITEDVEHEYGIDPPDIELIDTDRWLVDGTTSLDELNRKLDLSLEADGADRIAGWIAAQSGRFLKVGESVEAQGCKATVRKLRKHRIEQVVVKRLPRVAYGEGEALESEAEGQPW